MTLGRHGATLALGLCVWGRRWRQGRETQLAASAAGRGRLRVSHADREQVIDTLEAAFALRCPGRRIPRMIPQGNNLPGLLSHPHLLVRLLLFVLFAAVVSILASWREKRSGGQRPARVAVM